MSSFSLVSVMRDSFTRKLSTAYWKLMYTITDDIQDSSTLMNTTPSLSYERLWKKTFTNILKNYDAGREPMPYALEVTWRKKT